MDKPGKGEEFPLQIGTQFLVVVIGEREGDKGTFQVNGAKQPFKLSLHSGEEMKGGGDEANDELNRLRFFGYSH